MLRTVTFFNEKGGSGKSTFSAIFGSWLSYERHENVRLLDFDSPSYHAKSFRNIDEYYNNEQNKTFHKMCLDAGKPYPLEAIINNGSFTTEQMVKMARQLRERKEKEDGYLIFDFPGSLRPEDAVFHFAKEGLIDLFVIPVTADSQTRLSAIHVHALTHTNLFKSLSGKSNGQDCVFFWNEVTLSEIKSQEHKYINFENRLREKLDVDFCKTKIRQIPVLRRDPDNPLVFVRSTMCYPKINIRRYCPYMEELFQEIKQYLDKINEK